MQSGYVLLEKNFSKAFGVGDYNYPGAFDYVDSLYKSGKVIFAEMGVGGDGVQLNSRAPVNLTRIVNEDSVQYNLTIDSYLTYEESVGIRSAKYIIEVSNEQQDLLVCASVSPLYADN